MDRKLAEKIEKKHGKRIDTVLPPDYRQEVVGKYAIMVPYYRVKFQGARRFVFIRGEVH